MIGVFAVLFIGLMAWRLRRMMTATPFNPYRAWIIPLVFIAFTGFSIYHAWPIGPMVWLWLAIAALVGAGFGWLRGKSISMTYEPVSRQLFARGGAMAMLFIVTLIVVRTVVNIYLHTHEVSGLRTVEVDAISSTLGAGLFIARSIEMGLRGHKVLVANRGLTPSVASEAV
jgi:hypothetical protein